MIVNTADQPGGQGNARGVTTPTVHVLLTRATKTGLVRCGYMTVPLHHGIALAKVCMGVCRGKTTRLLHYVPAHARRHK